jgi:hypothetical protein
MYFVLLYFSYNSTRSTEVYLNKGRKINLLNHDVDITGNIKVIELLKTQMLTNLAELYESMNKTVVDNDNRQKVLANIAIVNYILASRLGIDYNTLDSKIINRLKIGVLEEHNSMHEDIEILLKHMDNKR